MKKIVLLLLAVMIFASFAHAKSAESLTTSIKDDVVVTIDNGAKSIGFGWLEFKDLPEDEASKYKEVKFKVKTAYLGITTAIDGYMSGGNETAKSYAVKFISNLKGKNEVVRVEDSSGNELKMANVTERTQDWAKSEFGNPMIGIVVPVKYMEGNPGGVELNLFNAIGEKTTIFIPDFYLKAMKEYFEGHNIKSGMN